LKIGTYPEITLNQARAELATLKARRDSGTCPLAEKKAARIAEKEAKEEAVKSDELKAFTVAKLIERYLSEHIDTGRKPKGAAEVRRMLVNDPVRVFGVKSSIEITSADVMSLINEILARGANVQAGNVLRELTAAYDFSSDKLPEDFNNPCYKVKAKMKQRRVRLTCQRGKRVLNDGELEQLLQWLPGSRYTPAQKNILLFTLMTGARTRLLQRLRLQNLPQSY
jgi:integrase